MTRDAPTGRMTLGGRVVELDVRLGSVDVVTATDEHGNTASVTITTKKAGPPVAITPPSLSMAQEPAPAVFFASR